jgi:hypothetical protein
LDDTKIMASKMTPFMRRHPGLAGGFAGGIIGGYRLL